MSVFLESSSPYRPCTGSALSLPVLFCLLSSLLDSAYFLALLSLFSRWKLKSTARTRTTRPRSTGCPRGSSKGKRGREGTGRSPCTDGTGKTGLQKDGHDRPDVRKGQGPQDPCGLHPVR